MKKKPVYLWKFLGIFLLTALMAAALFLFWAWISYRMRFSTEVIRVGLTLLYILPCLFGGRLIRGNKGFEALLWGALIGICYFGLILLISIGRSGGTADFKTIGLSIPLMCVLSGIAGALRLKKPHT